MNRDKDNRKTRGFKVKRSLGILSLGLMLLFVVGNRVHAEEARPGLRIGLVTEGPYQRSLDFLDILQAEVTAVCGERYVVTFPDEAQLDGGWSRDGVIEAVDRLLDDPDVDLIMTVGPAAAAYLCGLGQLPKPAVSVLAFTNSGGGCEGRSNLRVSPVLLEELVARDLKGFRRIVPFERLAVLTDASFLAGVDVTVLREQAAAEGISTAFIPVGAGDLDVMERLPTGTDAVYLLILEQIDQEAFDGLVHGLTEAGLPTFSIVGEEEVEQGVLAGMNSRTSVIPILRAGALDVLDLLEGVEERPSSSLPGTRLTLNMATARTLGLSPRWEVLSGACLLHEEDEPGQRSIDLGGAVRRAMEANLDLLVRERTLSAGREDIRDARSAYGPQLEAGVMGVMIDEDHAMPAFGQYARFASGSLTLTQLLYSDMASANVTIQKRLQEARDSDMEALRLDIARGAVGAYLDLMRADALVQIRHDDVDLKHANLDLARLRHSTGSAGAAEVLRWEAALASARAEVLDGRAKKRQAERQFSRLLDRPLTTRWQPARPDLDVALAILGGAGEATLLDSPNGYDHLTMTMIEAGLEAAPELAALDAAIAAQERLHAAARRATYTPTFGVQGDLAHVLAKDEEGGPDLGGIEDLFPEIEDTSWNVGLKASLPLITGGANKAQRIRAREELFRLRLDRRNAEEMLGQRILSALDETAASWPAISLRREAAEAASKTEKLVRDAYARGSASILDLLDAQNAALSAELAAMTAVYDFIDDWAEVQRSVAERDVLNP